MKLLILMLCTLLIHLQTAQLTQSEQCLDSTEECHSTDYESYVKCVRRRQKRSVGCQSSCDSGDCSNSCNSCDCDSCSYSTCDSCNSCCTSCCSNFVSCRTHHCCHKTCHAQCQSSSCRSNCRKNCFTSVNEKEREIVVGGSSSPLQRSDSSSSNITNKNAHNITTIIHLNNVINNTNIVDVPITLNNTNTQNITLYSEAAQAQGAVSETERCCTVIGPRQCISQSREPRCFHYRSKQCGAFCTADIVHKEQQQVCQSMYPGAPPSCTQQIFYIPQPRPRCVYQSAWPYVSCGVSRAETCQGCYGHYVDRTSQTFMSCPGQCYDQGYGAGPMYRQGPFYQPGYSHAPCYRCMGLPTPYGMMGMGGGYQGNVPYGGYPGLDSYPIYQQPPYIITLNSTVDGDLGAQLEEDPSFRYPRELEIEVKYELPSDAQAEVKIQKQGMLIEELAEVGEVPVGSEEAISVKEA